MKKISYGQVGDNYDTKDPIKKLAQRAARQTIIKEPDFEEVSDSRGESAFVWEQDKKLMAAVVEGLGTKNLVADAMRNGSKTYYDVIGYDTVATIINDLITVGAKPRVVLAYWAIEDNTWLEDKVRMTDFINGWRDACKVSMATWGGGETPTLKGIVEKGTIDLGGSAVGIIQSKERLITDRKLKVGDRIILLKSNGINCNGLSLARAVAKKMHQGYDTKLPSGRTYGQALLTTTNIYAKLIQDLLDSGVDIHYISNITGHGLRKIMRARGNFAYVIEKIFQPQEVFSFIQKHANLSDDEIYQTLNMGQDYAIFIPAKDVARTLEIIRKNKFGGLDAGYVEKGPRRVVIEPKHITFESETLDLR
ncbi:MAG: AIR synthase related protein [Candidatus Curtissbacteria bacterium]